MSDSADRTLEGPEKASNSLSHLIGSKDEEVRFLPDLSKTSHTECPYCHSAQSWEKDHCTNCGAGEIDYSIEKDARRNFSEREKYALIEEDGSASNAHKVDVKGSHYENQTADEIAMMILPLKGL